MKNTLANFFKLFYEIFYEIFYFTLIFFLSPINHFELNYFYIFTILLKYINII